MPRRPQYQPYARAPEHTTGIPWPVDPTAIGGDSPIIPHWMDAPKSSFYQAAPLSGPYANSALGTLTDVTARALWASPVFDLRPDLGGNYRPTATRIPGAARMHLQVRTSDGSFLSDIPSDLEVYSIESAHVLDPNNLRFIEERLDISSDFYQGTESTVLEWAPPGAPLRFWRIHVVFDWFGVLGTQPALVTDASAH